MTTFTNKLSYVYEKLLLYNVNTLNITEVHTLTMVNSKLCEAMDVNYLDLGIHSTMYNKSLHCTL